jgi:hypothetical protein
MRSASQNYTVLNCVLPYLDHKTAARVLVCAKALLWSAERGPKALCHAAAKWCKIAHTRIVPKVIELNRCCLQLCLSVVAVGAEYEYGGGVIALYNEDTKSTFKIHVTRQALYKGRKVLNRRVLFYDENEGPFSLLSVCSDIHQKWAVALPRVEVFRLLKVYLSQSWLLDMVTRIWDQHRFVVCRPDPVMFARASELLQVARDMSDYLPFLATQDGRILEVRNPQDLMAITEAPGVDVDDVAAESIMRNIMCRSNGRLSVTPFTSPVNIMRPGSVNFADYNT